MSRARRAAVVALSVAVVSIAIVLSLGTAEVNIHAARGLAVTGVVIVGAVAFLVFLIASVAVLAELATRRP